MRSETWLASILYSASVNRSRIGMVIGTVIWYSGDLVAIAHLPYTMTADCTSIFWDCMPEYIAVTLFRCSNTTVADPGGELGVAQLFFSLRWVLAQSGHTLGLGQSKISSLITLKVRGQMCSVRAELAGRATVIWILQSIYILKALSLLSNSISRFVSSSHNTVILHYAFHHYYIKSNIRVCIWNNKSNNRESPFQRIWSSQMHGNETNPRTDLDVHVQQHAYTSTNTHNYWERHTWVWSWWPWVLPLE